MEVMGQTINEVFNLVCANDLNELKNKYPRFEYSFVKDEQDKTPLDHAVANGYEEMTRWLLSTPGIDLAIRDVHDINSTLFSAVTGGNSKMIRLLLDAGMKRSFLNSMGNSAFDLTRVLGYELCGSAIINYVSEEDLTNFSSMRSADNKPELCPFLIGPLQEYIMKTNMHPVRLALDIPASFLCDANTNIIINFLLDMGWSKINNITNRYEMAMAYKLYYLAGVLYRIVQYGEVYKLYKVKKKKNNPYAYPDKFIKTILSSEKIIENFHMDVFMKCPFLRNEAFYQFSGDLMNSVNYKSIFDFIAILDACSRGFEYPEYIGQRTCGTCMEIGASLSCKTCKNVYYCDQRCQQLHSIHVKSCKTKKTREQKLQDMINYISSLD